MSRQCKPTQISTFILGAALALLRLPRGQQNVSVCWGFLLLCLFVCFPISSHTFSKKTGTKFRDQAPYIEIFGSAFQGTPLTI